MNILHQVIFNYTSQLMRIPCTCTSFSEASSSMTFITQKFPKLLKSMSLQYKFRHKSIVNAAKLSSHAFFPFLCIPTVESDQRIP